MQTYKKDIFNVTDRQTGGQADRRTDDMRSQDRALHDSASRGKNARTTLSVFFRGCLVPGALWLGVFWSRTFWFGDILSQGRFD